jgi:hypothetical protein
MGIATDLDEILKIVSFLYGLLFIMLFLICTLNVNLRS